MMAVERRHPLLAVQQEFHHARSKVAVASVLGTVGVRDPHQQAADRMPAVQGLHQALDLVAVPDVAPLEFGQGHVAAVDVVEDGRNLHCDSSLGGTVGVARYACAGWLRAFGYRRSSVPSVAMADR